MPGYVPPLRDMRFVLEELCDLAGLAKLEAYGHADPSVVGDLLTEAGRFMAETIAPLNQTGDREGSRLNPEDGAVSTPAGFRDAYRGYVEAGWGSVAMDPTYGGGGFPVLVGTALQELLTAANMAFSLCPMLTQGAIDMLSHHGSDELRARYLPKMITGEWTATMNLTEPDAGSDLGALRTRAVPAGDGTWRLTGSKVFITYGEHDMADNIVHLVLARTPDAPAGTRGISCFLVPKYLLDADGRPGERNDITCTWVEHKLGIHASPTCQLSYGEHGGAVGYLVGEEQRGMAAMFTMMNRARLAVGVEGLAIGERAYQQALAYATERRQGRAPGAPAGESSLIVEHPDVRRMLLTMKSTIEAMRRLLYTAAEAIDLSEHHPDPAVRAANSDRAALYIPLCKAWCTDMGVEVASLAVQVHGGVGYVEETGAPQHFRDARIAPIYEGTNGIQAIDLVTRKLGLSGGQAVTAHLGRIAEQAEELNAAGTDLSDVRDALVAALEATTEATNWLFSHSDDAADALAGATPYLRMLALTTAGSLMARSAAVAARAGGTDPWLASKVATARFFCCQLLPQVGGLLPAVRAGAAQLYALDEAALGS